MGMVRRLSRGFAGEEGVTRHVVRPGITFTRGAAEGVDGRAGLDVFEAEIFEEALPALTGQPTRNSRGPQIDVGQRLRRQGSAVGDVGELQPPTGPEHTEDLIEHRPLVDAEVDDAVGDHDIRPALLDR